MSFSDESLASSPGCANFGLRHLATEGQDPFNQSSVKFIQRIFIVDGLVSVTSDAEAIQLIKEVRDLSSADMLIRRMSSWGLLLCML